MLLELTDVHVRYGAIRALQGVSLHVGEGELVALIGSNGAGVRWGSVCLLGSGEDHSAASGAAARVTVITGERYGRSRGLD